VRLLIDSNSLLLFVVCLFFSLKNVFYLLSCGTNLNEKNILKKKPVLPSLFAGLKCERLVAKFQPFCQKNS